MPRAIVLALCIFIQLTLLAAAVAGAGVAAEGTKTTWIGPSRVSGRGIGAIEPLLMGVYDPHDVLRNSDGPRIEHVFVYWQALDEPMLAAKMRLAEMKARTLMVTVEPYTKAVNWRDGGEHLFADIVSGAFDHEIAAVCGALASYPGAYWIRWGHEMEQLSDRYPWARNDAPRYIVGREELPSR
ncbi:hypothetical protein SAZ10_30940 [Mesorhizobium sp. BAC0120]|uniref:hypothetical protein n=1 Tax=Mesorhizobium sp. BAC0120 TaxID=3090670 RepID=UPI00298CA45E|nr:hypothetical protein [Mesorhizobium sp. BAC0120]MDW6026184.1 hypothetical protein [Mesorhizobium sp. BAC0120]